MPHAVEQQGSMCTALAMADTILTGTLIHFHSENIKTFDSQNTTQSKTSQSQLIDRNPMNKFPAIHFK
jgi:hypothetical protein